MNLQEFMKAVKNKLNDQDFYSYHVDYLQRTGIIEPKRAGKKGVPRAFNQSDVRAAIDYYKDRRVV